MKKVVGHLFYQQNSIYSMFKLAFKNLFDHKIQITSLNLLFFPETEL